jgi:FHS family L-fucose permease-like MFS transporter
MVSLYWGGAMIGRLTGAALLARTPAPVLLGTFAAIACAICLFIVAIGGEVGGYAALAIGLFNSIMFPVIFTLTLERSTASQEATSGFLCFSIVGGAAIPVLVGLVSGATSYATAFVIPAICYALLLAFAFAAYRVAGRHMGDDVAMAAH